MQNTEHVTIEPDAEILDLAPPARRRVRPVKLVTIRDVRSEMAKLYREARAGEIDPQDMTRFVYALRSIGELIRDEDLERRIEALEGKTHGS